jgi:GT2 family glycosyltransferase
VSGAIPISAAIPTYRRGDVLLETLAALQSLDGRPSEILVLDQTEEHDPDVRRELSSLDQAGKIRWIRLCSPSIPAAMNRGLVEAREDIVLFLDDDIRPEPALIGSHLAAHAQGCNGLVAGRVIQPWQEGTDFSSDENFHFASLRKAWIHEFMGGNFSVRRDVARSLGGFDENFVGAAYRFEAEFASRFTAMYGPILYEPDALLHHLHLSSGGTRAHGDHLHTIRPAHSVGAYYFLMRVRPEGWWRQIPARAFRSIRTRHHLRQPWWIPMTLVSELRGFALALRLWSRGPKLLPTAGDLEEGK